MNDLLDQLLKLSIKSALEAGKKSHGNLRIFGF